MLRIAAIVFSSNMVGAPLMSIAAKQYASGPVSAASGGAVEVVNTVIGMVVAAHVVRAATTEVPPLTESSQ